MTGFLSALNQQKSDHTVFKNNQQLCIFIQHYE